MPQRRSVMEQEVDDLSDDELKVFARLLKKPPQKVTKGYLKRALRRNSIVGDWKGRRTKYKTPEEAIEEFRKLKI